MLENRSRHEEHKRLGSTMSPPTGNLYHLISRGSCGPQTLTMPIGYRRPKRRARATLHYGARSPGFYLRMLKELTFSPARPGAPRRAFTELRSHIALPLNVLRMYASGSRSLRPRWMNFLSTRLRVREHARQHRCFAGTFQQA